MLVEISPYIPFERIDGKYIYVYLVLIHKKNTFIEYFVINDSRPTSYSDVKIIIVRL